MKQLVGSDVGQYSFNPATRGITFTSLPPSFSLVNVLVITNLTAGAMIYNFADPTLGGDLTGNVLTLNTDTTAMQSTDVLQIWVDLPSVSVLSDLLIVMRQMITALVYPPHLDRSQNRSRVTALVESGTVTTVTTVTGISNLDGYQSKLPVINTNLNAWANVVRRKFS
jgi:hypothetical protein